MEIIQKKIQITLVENKEKAHQAIRCITGIMQEQIPGVKVI